MDKKRMAGLGITEGPEDFRMYASSAGLYKELNAVTDIDDYFEKNKKNMLSHNLTFHLEMLLEQKDTTKAKVARRSLLDRKYIYQIFDGQKNPSRDKFIAIAFGFGLSAEETQTLLKVSENRELYVRDKRDAVILFALQRNMSIYKVNELLYKYNFELLGVPQE